LAPSLHTSSARFVGGSDRTLGLRAASLALAVAVLPLVGACQRTGDPAPVAVGTAAPAFGGVATVEPGDSLSTLAQRYGVSQQELAAANNLSPPYHITPGQRLNLPAPHRYTVQRGDTLLGIARMVGVDSNEIARANNLSPPYSIQAGQTLALPGGGAPAESSAPASAPVRRGTVETTALPPPGTAPAAKPQGQPLPPPGAAPAPIAPPPAAQPAATPSQAPQSLTPPPAKPAEPKAADPKPAEPKPEAAPPKPAEEAAPKPEKPAAPAADGPAVGDSSSGGGQFLWPVKGKLISGYGPKPDGTHNDGLNIAATKGTPVIAADGGVVAYSGNELKGFGNLLLIRHNGGWMTAYAHLDGLKVERGAKVKRGQTIGTVGQSGAVDSPQLHFEVRKGSQAVDPNGHM
jgi:murein DD-endopeptidase MepM/ murein hydrolase activator NlpD